MRRPTRNRRTKSTGQPPTPTPEYLWAGDAAVAAGFVSISVRELATNDFIGGGSIPLAELSINPARSETMLRNVSTGELTRLEVLSINDSSGTATVNWDTSAVSAGDYTVMNLGNDPSIRGVNGAWLPAFSYPVTLP